MARERFSLLVDAAYLQIRTRESYKSWYTENGKKKPSKLTQYDWFSGFWVTIAGFLHYETVEGRDYLENGVPSLYIFDALYDDDRANDWSPIRNWAHGFRAVSSNPATQRANGADAFALRASAPLIGALCVIQNLG